MKVYVVMESVTEYNDEVYRIGEGGTQYLTFQFLEDAKYHAKLRLREILAGKEVEASWKPGTFYSTGFNIGDFGETGYYDYELTGIVEAFLCETDPERFPTYKEVRVEQWDLDSYKNFIEWAEKKDINWWEHVPQLVEVVELEVL